MKKSMIFGIPSIKHLQEITKIPHHHGRGFLLFFIINFHFLSFFRFLLEFFATADGSLDLGEEISMLTEVVLRIFTSLPELGLTI